MVEKELSHIDEGNILSQSKKASKELGLEGPTHEFKYGFETWIMEEVIGSFHNMESCSYILGTFVSINTRNRIQFGEDLHT